MDWSSPVQHTSNTMECHPPPPPLRLRQRNPWCLCSDPFRSVRMPKKSVPWAARVRGKQWLKLPESLFSQSVENHSAVLQADAFIVARTLLDLHICIFVCGTFAKWSSAITKICGKKKLRKAESQRRSASLSSSHWDDDEVQFVQSPDGWCWCRPFSAFPYSKISQEKTSRFFQNEKSTASQTILASDITSYLFKPNNFPIKSPNQPNLQSQTRVGTSFPLSFRFAPRGSMATRSRIIDMVGSKQRRKISLTTSGRYDQNKSTNKKNHLERKTKTSNAGHPCGEHLVSKTHKAPKPGPKQSRVHRYIFWNVFSVFSKIWYMYDVDVFQDLRI